MERKRHREKYGAVKGQRQKRRKCEREAGERERGGGRGDDISGTDWEMGEL